MSTDAMMGVRDLVFEVGVEELPARLCQPALDQLAVDAAGAFERERLDHNGVEVVGTPRRLVLVVHGLAAVQRDRDTVSRGPAASAAFDAEGKPTRAAEGFARGQGVAVTDLQREVGDGGREYMVARKHEKGLSTVDLLPGLLAGLVAGLRFPTTMRWADGSTRFARPLRWLLCLYGEAVVPVTIGALTAGRETFGHRTLSPGPHIVGSAELYRGVCEQGAIVVDPRERQAQIVAQVAERAREVGGVVEPDADLLEELTWLVEKPLAFIGSFDTAFLDVPAPVLITSMKVNQRYVELWSSEGDRLLPYFVAVRNGDGPGLDIVRHGNEKVLRARLSDARFFWDEDRKRTLEERREDLRAVVFHAGLGSQFDRSVRLERLARHIAVSLDLSSERQQLVAVAAGLAKGDLTTAMVGEFPELQGVMGGAYAREEGLDPLIVTGIATHYQPRATDDALPDREVGALVGLADRFDTLVGFFALGLEPTGSADPFALRRAAQGAVAIVVGQDLRLSLPALVNAAAEQYRHHGIVATGEALKKVSAFVTTRLETLWRDRGSGGDVVDAVIATGVDDMVDATRRVEALSRALADPAFAAVSGSFKRVANIARKAEEEVGDNGVNVPMSEAAPREERVLREAFDAVETDAVAALASADYDRFYVIAATLKGPIDSFFDAVLVLDPDPTLRLPRLALLRRIADLLTKPADLTRLAGQSQS